jgi:hypothetical protein
LHLVISPGLFQLSHVGLQIVAFPLCPTFSLIYTSYLITINLKQVSSYVQEANYLKGKSPFQYSVVCHESFPLIGMIMLNILGH